MTPPSTRRDQGRPEGLRGLQAWRWLERKDFHKLSLVDAISFVLMKKHRIRHALAFDTHFAQAGFHIVA